MTHTEAQAFLARVSYKPGWSLKLDSMGWLTVAAKFKESSDTTLVIYPGDTLQIYNTQQLQLEEMNEPRLLSIVHDMVAFLESHELAEWFKLDGKKVRDPHIYKV